MNFLSGGILFLIIFASSEASASESKETMQESPVSADPLHPSTLDSRDPSFEELAGHRYKSSANYKIREFKEGTVQALSDHFDSLERQARFNLEEISKLQSKAHSLNYTDKEQWVAGLADLAKQQRQFLENLGAYKEGRYQTNISAQSLRLELSKITQEVVNMRNLLGSWQKENKTAWE